MSDKSAIEWTDATWNPVTGCSVLSPGCKNCYAMDLAGTRLKNHPSRAGLTKDTKAGPVWTGEVRFNGQWLTQPLQWKKPRMVFVCAHGDLFHENVPDAWIDKVFAVMALAPQHTFQVLTKRAKRMRDWVTDPDTGDGHINSYHRVLDHAEHMIAGEALAGFEAPPWPLPNVWLGVSAERQEEANERIPELLATPATVRFVSLEPLLGPIDLTRIAAPKDPEDPDAEWFFDALATGDMYEQRTSEDWEEVERYDCGDGPYRKTKVDQVIVGGESGDRARAMHPAWPRSLRDQCAGAGVAFFFKQWGEWAPYDRGAIDSRQLATAKSLDQPLQRFGKKAAGRLLDGVEHNAFPTRETDNGV